jgi:hypothetical protein
MKLKDACLIEGLEDSFWISCHTGEKPEAVQLPLAHEGAMIPLIV